MVEIRALLPAGVAIVLGIGLATIIVTSEPGTNRSPVTLSSINTSPVTAAPGGTIPEVAPELAPTTSLGALGDVGTGARLRAAVNAATQRGLTPAQAAAPPCTRTAPRAVGLILAGAYATGSVSADPVTVLVGTAANGTRIAVALYATDCSIALRVELRN